MSKQQTQHQPIRRHFVIWPVFGLCAGLTSRRGLELGATAPVLLRKSLLMLSLLTAISLNACSKHPDITDDVQRLTFSTLTGEQLNVDELTVPLLVNFWATDCGICLKEMPDLAELYTHYKPAGFELVAIAMPYDAPNLVLEMSEREQWPFPVALDIKGEALQSFTSVIGTPTSYLLDKSGKLIKRYEGAIPMNDLKKNLDKLLELS